MKSATSNPETARPGSQTARQQGDRRWPGANLFRNPFGELTRNERAELAVIRLDSIFAALGTAAQEPSDECSDGDDDHKTNRDIRICRRHRAYQLIGDCGRGKTTRLLAIKRQVPTASYVYLPEDGLCPSIPLGDPLLIDEAQRLPRPVRRSVFSSGVPLVLATHKNLAPELRRRGYLVTTEQIGLSLSAEHLSEILNRRILASRRHRDQPAATISLDIAQELLRRFGTDVRRIEGYLYEVVQSQVMHHGEMRFID